MYIDATSVGAADRRFEGEVVELIRAAIQPFEARVHRIEVHVTSNPEGNVCRLRAWAERGQTVVIESCARSRRGAIETAAESLKRTIAGRTPRVPAAAAADLTSAPVSQTARPAGEGPMSRPRVLLAMRELDASNACLPWARVLTDALQADLDVCRVLPNAPADVTSPAKAWLDGTRRLLSATRETRRWCAEALPDATFSEGLSPGAVDSVEQAALRARERRVDWIVMSDLHDGCGKSATSLARASGCPVLVARAPTTRSTLLIATDVSDDLDLISSRTATLAEALQAPVLAFHDVGFRAPELSSRVNALTDAWSRVQAERLKAGDHRRLPELEVLLAHGTDRVRTILQQARREDAEIIIVGVPENASAGADDVAAAVVERAIRSVLVVPSNGTREARRQRRLPDEPRSSPLSSTGVALERPRLPRAGPPTSHSSEHRG